jgi:hypothetical protein
MVDKPKIPTWNPEFIRDLSEKVYREHLGPDDVRRMIEQDGDEGQKLRKRSDSYDKLSRTYLGVLGFKPPVE